MKTEVFNRPNPPSQAVPSRDDLRNDSIPGLIWTFAQDLSTLLGKELALAKAEVREASAGYRALAAFS